MKFCERTPSAQQCQSELFDILPRPDIIHIAPLITLCQVEPRQVLMRRGELIRRVYLPYDAVLATVVEFHNGLMPETSIIGNEGFAPLPALFHGTHASDTVVCMLGGICASIRLADFQHEAQSNPRLNLLLKQYAQAYRMQMSARVACNALHTLRQRYASTMLSIDDRTRGEAFNISQDFLSLLLGVYRPSLSVVAQEYQQNNVIAYVRGHMQVLDRAALEACACECYAHSRARFERLLGIRVG